MIYFHKILPLVLSPLTVVILLMVSGIIFKRQLLIYLAVFLLFICSTPIAATCLIKYLEGNQTHLSEKDVKPADAIVVLGGMLSLVPKGQGVDFEWLDPDRFFGGVDLAIVNKAHYLIFFGGKLPWERAVISEGTFLKQKALSYGISEDRVLVTQPVQNTKQEALALKELLEGKLGAGHKNIILVTSAFHMERAKALFIQNGFIVTAYPVDFKVNSSDLTPMSFMPSAYALKDVELALRELMGRLYYSSLRLFSL